MVELKVDTGQSDGIINFFDWNQFSSLQKLLIISMVVIVVSWLSSWTLLLLFFLCVAGALKLSRMISHHEGGPMIAENIILKLEEAYVWGCHTLNSVKVIFRYQNVEGETSPENHQRVDDSNLSADDSDKLFDNSTNAIVGSEINSLQLLIIRDFVQSWYSTFSYNNQFLRESKYTIQQSCNNIAVSLSNQNTQVVITSLLKIIRVHMTAYMKAKSVFDSHQIHPKTKVPKDSMKRYTSVEEAFEKQFGFHEALATDETEMNYLRGIMSIVLLSACPKTITEGICSRTLLVEIITNNAFLPLINMMSDPDWLMEKIILLTSDEDIDSYDNGRTQTTETSEIVEESLKCLSQDFSQCDENIHSIEKMSYNQESLCENDGSQTNSIDKEKDQLGSQENLKNVQENIQDQDHVTNSENEAQTVSLQCTVSDEAKNGNGDGEASSEQCSVSCESPCHVGSEESKGKITLNPVDKSEGADCVCDKAAKTNVLENSSLESTLENKLEAISEERNNSEHPQETLQFQNSLHDSESSTSEQEVYLTDSGEQYLVINSNPQKIISLHKSVSVPATTSGSPTVPSDSLSSSFPKFSSLKSFIVDSFKSSSKNSNAEKPRTLELFPNNLTSTSKSRTPFLGKVSPSVSSISTTSNNSPPVVLIDGRPADNISTEKDVPHSSQSRTSDQAGTAVIDVSPGFPSGAQPFFSKSVSQTDLTVSNLEVLEESPVVTPSPTDANTFYLELTGDHEHKRNREKEKLYDIDQNMAKSYTSDDQKIFQDISIPHAITNQEFRSSAQYSLYVIEYEAFHFNEEGKYVLNSGTVKRRHREFTNLQSRLESYPGFKKHLKNIRGPRRWPTLPFKSLDKDTVESRRQFLEKYLKDLISVESICNGPDLREFLAYEGDSHIAFVKKSPDISVPRIDKMLMKGMTEVFDKIKSIPNIPSEVMSGLRSKEIMEEKSSEPKSQIDTDAMEVRTDFDDEGINRQGSIFDLICVQWVIDHSKKSDDDDDLFNMSYMMEELKGNDRTQETYRQEVDKLLSSLPRTQEEGENGETSESQPQNISPVLLELLVQGLQGRNHWLCREHAVKLLQAVFGKALNSFMETTIQDLTSTPQLVIYLRLLRETMWPQGQLWSDSKPPKTDEEKAATREKAKKCLKKFFPRILQKFVGENDFDALLEVYISCLHCPKLNRHLLYHLLDRLCEQLFPEATSCEMLQTLLFSSTSSDSCL